MLYKFWFAGCKHVLWFTDKGCICAFQKFNQKWHLYTYTMYILIHTTTYTCIIHFVFLPRNVKAPDVWKAHLKMSHSINLKMTIVKLKISFWLLALKRQILLISNRYFGLGKTLKTEWAVSIFCYNSEILRHL